MIEKEQLQWGRLNQIIWSLKSYIVLGRFFEVLSKRQLDAIYNEDDAHDKTMQANDRTYITQSGFFLLRHLYF
jgi:hypothetical protein